MRPEMLPVQVTRFESVTAFFNANRVLNWQDEMRHLLDTGKVTVSALKKAQPRNQNISDVLAQLATASR